MEPSQVSQALAEAFWHGWIPTDLPTDYLEALDLSAMGPQGLEELQGLVTRWEARLLDDEGLAAQAEGLRESFRAAAIQAEAVAEPAHEAIRFLLEALREGLHAMSESCAGVASGVRERHGGAFRQSMAAAEEAALTLQEIYEGTHFES